MEECCVCLREFDRGYMTSEKSLCCFCRDKLKPGDLHPLTRLPMQVCKCGKLWNQFCAIRSMAVGYTVSPQLFAACKTPEERRALFKNPDALTPTGNEHGLVK